MNPVALAIAADGTFLTVALGGKQFGGATIPPAIVRIDSQSGDRVVVSGGVEDRGSGLALRNPLAIALEADGAMVVVDCGGSCLFPLPPTQHPSIPPTVVRIDPDTGARTVVLGGPGTTDVDLLFLMPSDIAVHKDGTLSVAGGFIVSAAVTQVDPETGAPTLLSGVRISGKMAGRGQSLAVPFGIAVNTDDTIIVADAFLGAIVAVEPTSGARTIISK